MRKLVLIDGNAIVHRAYHALPPLTHGKGVMTNAVYGFFAMVLKMIQDLQPSYLVVAFDRAAPTFRKQMYAGYQATRPKLADDLAPQFGILHDVLRKAKIKVEELDGFEADDIIGTLSEQANKKGINTIILTGDRDMLQLVDRDTWVLAPVVGVSKAVLYDEAKVKEKYGLNPSQIVDYKALVGDSSDNYPGVSGIGPKTASDLVSRFGSLEGIYKNLGEISPNLQIKLATDAEQAALAKKLATIDLNAPVKVDWKNSELSKMDTKAMFLAFNELGFRSLIARFPHFGEAPRGKGSFDTSSHHSSVQVKQTKPQAKPKKENNSNQLDLL